MGSVDIQMVQGALVAPAAIWFDAVNISGFNVSAGAAPGEVYEPGFHDITFIWDFGETGDTQYAAPLNIPDAWNDRNIAYGKRACHVFREPGSYTVSLWCVDSDGTVGQASVSITVSNPDSVYSGGRTICFDGAGNFANAPAGAQQVSSISALDTAIRNLTQSGRILFRAGSDVSGFALNIDGSAYDQDLHFGSWGSGAKPVIRAPRDGTIFRFDQNTPVVERKFVGLDLRGSWDAAAEVGGLEFPFDIGLSDPPDFIHLIHDCVLNGFESLRLATLKNIPFLSVLSDSIVENWQYYGLYCATQFDGVNTGAKIAILGSAIQQHPDACDGNLSEGHGNARSNEHGPLRYETTKNFLIRSSYFYSVNSWAGGAQPCLRIATRNEDGYFIGDRVTFEGGSTVFENKIVYGTDTGNFLFDRILALGTADTVNTFITQYGGTTIRNSYVWLPDVVRNTTVNPEGIFTKEGGAVLSDPVKLYNTTAVYLFSGNNVGLVDSDWTSEFSNYTTENNLIHAPNQNSPAIQDNPDLTTSIAGVTPRYPGLRKSITKPTATASGSSNTLTFAYPVNLQDDTTTGASDYSAGAGRHYIRHQGDNSRYYREDGDLSVSLGASITVTRSSGNWPAGTYDLGMDFLGFATDASRASPATVPLPRPTSGNPPYQSANAGLVALDDLLLSRRPGLPVAGSPAGTTASRGSLEP